MYLSAEIRLASVGNSRRQHLALWCEVWRCNAVRIYPPLMVGTPYPLASW